MPSDRSPTIAVIVKGWPRLSETFIAQELVGLEGLGLRLRLYSLRHPTDGKVHDLARALAGPVAYLPEYLWREPWRVWRGWRRARRFPGYAHARWTWRRDLARDPTPNRVRRFGQALVLAAELAADVRHLYAHFLHTPASVARYAAIMRELPWSASAHAKDIWTTPEWEKREKLADAAWVVTCTSAGAEHLRALAPRPASVELVYHGIDPARFPPPVAPRAPRDGRQMDDPVTILSVGRAVEKKGYDDLLRALGRLPRDRAWRFIHIGGGPLLRRLKRQAERLSIDARVEWLGTQTQDAVRAAYGRADLFVLASRLAADGDRDGLPNVLLEAMSQGCAVVACNISAIPELIEDGVNGLLAPANDADALARAILRAIADPHLRERLAVAAASRVHAEFGHACGIARIAARLGGEDASARMISSKDAQLARDAQTCALRSTRR
jgi:glycosyltransferase involved in cell wall biosynthesis